MAAYVVLRADPGGGAGDRDQRAGHAHQEPRPPLVITDPDEAIEGWIPACYTADAIEVTEDRERFAALPIEELVLDESGSRSVQ